MKILELFGLKFSAVLVCVVLALTIVAPAMREVFAVNPANMNVIQYRYFSDSNSLFNGLLTPDNAGGVDVMGWALTKAQYQSAMTYTNITVEPLYQPGEYEMAFNNNYTDGLQMDRRSPMNFTDFRNALNCLVDKQSVINGTILGGFATQSDTEIPTPVMASYVNAAISGANYPWKFNVTNALQILYNGGWYSRTVYPTFASLLTAYGGGVGPLSTAGGTTSGVVYSGNDTNGQWGGGDPQAAANAALVNTPLAPLMGRVRIIDARRDLGDFFCAELKAIGCPYTELYYATLGALRPYVFAAQIYDFATLGYSFSSPPNWWYDSLTPAGIYANGPNPYLVDDTNTTFYATKAFTDPTPASFMADQLAVQYNLVMESYLVPCYSPATYCAYKTGMLGQIDELGYGTQGSMYGGPTQLMNWVTLNSRKTNTINYTGPPESTPDSNIIYYGTYNPPDMLNPIFSWGQWDYQILDEIFTYPIASNPYNTMTLGSAITGWPSGGDVPWMAYSWKTQLINDPTNSSNPQWTNVTLWFRHDITWHDGVPFTVADLNYTIYESALYGDSWNNYNAVLCVNASNGYAPYFTQWDNWTCSILVTSPSWSNLYIPMSEIVPEHLYKYIVPNNLTVAEQGWSTDGLHGLWPGQAAVSSNFLPVPNGAPGLAPYITYGNVTGLPDYTLVGTGPWKYRVGSTSASQFTPGGGITLDAYNGFFLKPALGEMDFRYKWLNTDPNAQPSGGYYTIGLTDLVTLANAYGRVGTPPASVPLSGVPGSFQVWNPACDVAAPSGVVGLSDLVTLVLRYHWCWGNYSYNAPYPPSEIANGGP